MRILAIDAGNSRIKWGVHEDGSWVVQGWVATARASQLARAWSGVAPPEVAIAANVAGAGAARAIVAAARGFRGRLRFVKSETLQCGVRNSYDEPGQLGPDRWAALIGARHIHRGACVVINAGTTMTVDALAADGVFLGGMIVPGTDMMRFMEQAGQDRPLAIVSGGGAQLVAPQLNGTVEVVDNLVLEGLVHIALDSSAVSRQSSRVGKQ
jgi:type III pantothenate kinase